MVTTRTNLAPCAPGPDASHWKTGPHDNWESARWERANERKSRIDRLKMEGTLIPASFGFVYVLSRERGTYVVTFFSKAKCIIFKQKQVGFSDLVSFGRSRRLDVSATHDRSTYTSLSVSSSLAIRYIKKYILRGERRDTRRELKVTSRHEVPRGNDITKWKTKR